MSSNVYALFIWYDDNPITGNVMNISAVSVPRKEYTDYRVGDAVKARCGSFGVVPAIIGKIGDKDEKKDMERLLKTPEAFSTLIDSFPEILLMRNKGNGEPKKSSDNSEEAVPRPDNSEETVPNSDNSVEIVSKLQEADADSQKQMGNESKKAKNQTVVKPKAVRRKLPIDPEVKSPKEIQSEAEDRALAGFQIENNKSSSQIIRESLELVNSTGQTPRKSPRRKSVLTVENQTLETIKQQERLEGANRDLQSRVACLEYQTGILWNEVEQMKFHFSQSQMNAMRSQPQTFSPTVVSTSAFSKPDEQSVGVQGELTPSNKISQNEPTYNGYLKSQVLDLLEGCKDFKKGTTTIFRKIFTEEETRGRSLTGGVAKDGTRRPAIEDQSKITFLIECIKQKWPSTMNDAVKLVLRDLLKPSRAKTKSN